MVCDTVLVVPEGTPSQLKLWFCDPPTAVPVRLILSPTHTLTADTESVDVSAGTTDTVMAASAGQPIEVLPNTEYVVVAVGVTTTEEVVPRKPFDEVQE